MKTDKNECTDGSHNCDKNAICENIDGSFTCECQDGYEGTDTCTGNQAYWKIVRNNEIHWVI